MEPGRLRGAEHGLGAARANNEPATGAPVTALRREASRQKAAPARARRSKVVPRKFQLSSLSGICPAGREFFRCSAKSGKEDFIP